MLASLNLDLLQVHELAFWSRFPMMRYLAQPWWQEGRVLVLPQLGMQDFYVVGPQKQKEEVIIVVSSVRLDV